MWLIYEPREREVRSARVWLGVLYLKVLRRMGSYPVCFRVERVAFMRLNE